MEHINDNGTNQHIVCSMSSTNSLLDFAVNQMVDYKRDVMMHLTLMQFFSEWILRSKAQNLRSRTTMPSYPDSSPALHYMEASGLHARTVGYYHSPSEMDSFESKVLYSQAGRCIRGPDGLPLNSDVIF